MKIKLLKFLFNATICALFILGASSVSYAQRNYVFENISIPEGLSNSTINYIFQDSNGFLWISTADGLNRYDGNNFKIFKNDPDDSTTLPNNNCFAIAEDKDGFIWVGVSGNVIARYNPINETFLRYSIDTGNLTGQSEYYSALNDSKGNLWFGTTKHGMQKFNRSKNKFEQVKLDSSNIKNQWGEIYSITELREGKLIASDYASGIKIYNEKLNVFQPYNFNSEINLTQIQSIIEDTNDIWLGGLNDLIKYSKSTSSFVNYYKANFNVPPYDDNITGMTLDNEGYLWIAYFWQGLYRVDPKTKEPQKYGYGSDNSDISTRQIIQSIYKDNYGVIWIGKNGFGLTKFDPLKEPFNFTKIKNETALNSGNNYVTTIAGSDNDKEILAGTSTGGLFSYNPENKILNKLNVNFVQQTDQGGKVNIQGLAIDKEGNKWLAYNNLGLHKLDKNNNLSIINSLPIKRTTTYNIYLINPDPSGNIWVASLYGFEKYNPVKKEFTILPTIMTKRMSETLNRGIHKIVQSREPISSILKVGEASNSEKTFTLNKNQKVLVIGVGEGRIIQGNHGMFDFGSLLSNDGKLIWTMNDLSGTFNVGGGYKNRISVKCLDLKKGDYKISFTSDVGNSYGNWNVVPPADSTWYGIQVLTLSESEFNNLNELNEKEIKSDKYMPMEIGTGIEFSKKYQNIVWLGSIRNGFFKYDLSTGNYKQYNYDSKNQFSPNNSAFNILEDNKGIVWFTTQNSLVRFDPETEKIEKFSEKDGLPSNQLNSLTEDNEGNLWINTSGGLSKLNKNASVNNRNFVNYDTKDGLPGFSNSNASWVNKDGEIVLGANDGLISFYPGKINETKPDIVIEDIKVSDISLKSDSSAVKIQKSVMKLDELDLSYAENNLSFEFASIHFSRPEKNKIMYKLEGFNNNWISTDRNFVSYTNLSSGEYTFRVKGSNGDGIWNEEGKSIKIIINPPWWETTFAYIGYFFLFAGLVFGIDRFQRKRVVEKERALAKEKELEQAKEIEKAYTELKATQAQLVHSEKMASLGELTAGIAHEIKNPLNFINNFSEISNELLDEVKTELKNKNEEEVADLIVNLKQNLEKINQHGKRADSIVKGMLLHSRGASGEKTLTDINDLLDQYVNLAYHGMRAQNKEFNITIEKDYDETLEKINVVPQDISRVFLNIINNACYAAYDKKKKSGDNNFSPVLRVSTKNLKDKVEIRIADNGNGIPKDILDKIFQPFFTTKPTGEGTGLGLSLSYDIVVKQHGGEMKVETKEGEGTAFIIKLTV